MALTWDKVALSDTFRTASPLEKGKMRNQWLSQIAPTLYPQIVQNPQAYTQLRQSTFQQIPDKLPDEDAIIRPQYLSMEGLQKLELNPEFGKKDFAEQLQLRQVWLAKTAVRDPEFQKLSLEQKEEYARSIMMRPPSGYGNPNIYDLEYSREEVMNEILKNPKWLQKAGSYSEQFVRGVVGTGGAIVFGPLKWASRKIWGDNNNFTAIGDAWTNYGQWLQYVSEANNPIPAFVGSIAGLTVGPFPKLESLLAGGVKGATATGKLIKTAGVLEKAGKAVGAKLPSLAYQVAGGSVAGGLLGISQALGEDKPWHSYLLTDATLGVGLEFASRYLGAIREVRKVTRAVGYKGKLSDFFQVPFETGKSIDLDPDYMKILKADPKFKDLLDTKKLVDSQGFILENYKTKPVINMRADIVDYKIDWSEGKAAVKDKQGNLLREFAGPESVVTQKVSDWIDLQDSAWNKKLGKPLEELVESTPRIELREGLIIPEGARKKILSTLKDYNINLGYDYTLDPQGDTAIIDRIYGILQKQGIKKATTSLNALGIQFGMNAIDSTSRVRANRAAVRQLKSDLALLKPDNAYFVVNKNTGKMMPTSEIPSMFLEHPALKDPFLMQKTWVGNAGQLRNQLDGLRKVYANEKRAVTILSKKSGMQLSRYNDTRVVQMKLDIPDAGGKPYSTVLNFNSLQDAHKFLQGGTDAAIERVFKESPGLQQGFKQFQKSAQKTGQFKNDMLPFKYLSKEASDQGFALSHYKGQYIIEDTLAEAPTLTKFNTLEDAGNWLKEHDRLRVADHMLAMTPEVFEELYPNGVDIDPITDPNPLATLAQMEQKQKKYWGITDIMKLKFLPTQYAFELFEKHKIGAKLRSHGMSPVEMHNLLRKGVESSNSWIAARVKTIQRLSKGFDEDMASYARRWWEALDDVSEEKLLGHTYDLKSDLEKEMISKFGQTKAGQIMDTSVKVHDLLEELFYQGGLDQATYVKHYMPHLRSQMSKANGRMSQHFDLRRMANQIPKTDQPAFFEFLREADPKAVAWEENIFRLANNYITAMGKRRFLAPVTTEIADHIKKVQKTLLDGAQDADYKAFINYVQDLFRAIQGTNTPGEEVFKLASNATLENLAKTFKVPLKKNSADIVQKLLTGTAGAYLAGRPWSVGKQLTQSLLTGSPLIGVRSWVMGLNKVTEPGALQQLMRIGVINSGQVPTGAGFALSTAGPVGKAIRAGMAPYKWGDWINRAVTYYGMQARFQGAAKKFMTGKITKSQFLKQSGMNLFGKAQYNYGLKLLKTNDFATGMQALEDHVCRLASNRTQYLYDKFEHPQLFRSGLGRLAGQFSTWPINYASYIANVMSTGSTSIAQKAQFLTTLTAVSAAVATGLRQAGISSDRFLPWNSVLFQGGPYYQMMNDGLAAINGDQGRWPAFSRALTGLVPFSREGEGVFNAIQSFEDGDMWEGMLHLMSAPIYQDTYPTKQSTPLDAVENRLVTAGLRFFNKKEQLEEKVTSLGGILD